MLALQFSNSLIIHKTEIHNREGSLDTRSSLNAPLLVVFSTLFSVFGYPHEALSLVFDILLHSFVYVFYISC